MWSRNVPMDISGTNKQRQRGRKRFYGRRRRKNPGRQALRKVNRIEKVLQRGQNLKSINTSIAASFAAGSSIQSLVTMNRGDTNYLREGDKITLKNMTWRIRLYLNNAETSPTAVRFVIVYDRRPNGAQAAVTDVLNSNTIDGLMNLSEDVRGRFQVIHDQFWQLSTGGNELAIEKGFKDLKNKKVLYDANVGDITDIQQGNLFGIFYAAGNAANVGAVGQIRIRFVDDN